MRGQLKRSGRRISQSITMGQCQQHLIPVLSVTAQCVWLHGTSAVERQLGDAQRLAMEAQWLAADAASARRPACPALHPACPALHMAGLCTHRHICLLRARAHTAVQVAHGRQRGADPRVACRRHAADAARKPRALRHGHSGGTEQGQRGLRCLLLLLSASRGGSRGTTSACLLSGLRGSCGAG